MAQDSDDAGLGTQQARDQYGEQPDGYGLGHDDGGHLSDGTAVLSAVSNWQPGVDYSSRKVK